MSKTTTTTREYDDQGRIVKEVTVETDNRHTCTSYCRCYPVYPTTRYPYLPVSPYWSTTTISNTN